MADRLAIPITRASTPSRPPESGYLSAHGAVVVALFIGSLLPLRCAGAPPLELVLDTKDGARSALLVVPDEAPGRPLPLVILLHARGGSAAATLGLRRSLAAPLSAWLPIVRREQMMVLALQGLRGSSALAGWDDCRGDDPSKPSADDVSYALAVVDLVKQKHLIDARRIYLMGVSNGAMMAFRLAAQAELPIAAIAAVSGTMPAASICPEPSRPMSVLLISGTADPLVPYQGGAVHFGSAESGSVLSVDDTLARWRRIDGLFGAPSIEALPPLPGTDGKTSATRLTWGAKASSPQVELIRIDGGGHTEPSIDQVYGSIYLGLAGAQNHDLESAEEAWRFFRDKTSLTIGPDS